MRVSLILSVIVIASLAIILVPEASALPVSYNTTTINLGMTSVPRNSSSYDVFTLNQDNWLWAKFDNNTVDSSPLSINSMITYNTNAKAVYHFENVTTDSTTNGFTLTKVAGTNRFVSGAEGKGVQFDGSTYYTASSSAVVTGSNDRSISFWIYTPSTFVQSNYVYSYGVNTNNNLWLFEWTSNAATSGFTLFTGGGSGQNISSNAVLNPNTWYYITTTLSSSGTVVTFYVNGVQDKQSTITALNTSSSSLFLGAFIDGSSKLQNGVIIDEFRIYNIAISAAQANALHMVGHYSQSHTFDGGEYVSLGNNFGFEYNQPFSIAGWIKTTSSGTSSFVSKLQSAGTFTGYEFQMSAGQLFVYLIDDFGGNKYIQKTSTATYNDGNWHYVAFTYDGSHLAAGLQVYVDGSSITTTTNSDTLGTNTILNAVNFQLGGRNGANNPLIGQLDNMKVYPYALTSSQINSDYNSISPISSGKQYMSWYNGISGSATLTKKLGDGQSTITTSCNLSNVNPVIISNVTNIYYICTASNLVKQVSIQTGTSSTYFAIQTPSGVNHKYLFSTMQNIIALSSSSSGFNTILSTKTSNSSTGLVPTMWTATDQKIFNSTNGLKYNMNTTTMQTVSTNPCEINYKPTNTTKTIDSIACDQSIPAMAIKYWNGFMIQKVANYNTNTTQQFLSSIDNSAYKKLLSLPCLILVNETPCVDFIATDFSGNDYLVVLTSTHVYYKNAQTALTYLLHNNYAFQSYDVVTTLTTPAYEIQNPILQSMTLYGFGLNTTIQKAGLFTLPSGDYIRTTTVSPSIRTIDPQWTNDATDIPIISTTSSLFPIFLTVNNAPIFSAIKVTQGNQLINNIEAVWAVAQLDSTRSVEVDLPSGTCANVYIADISISPSIWNFQGIICATGVNQKTLAYTNTLPLTFFTLKYGVTQSYNPTNNALAVTTRSSTSPFTYNVIVKNSTGAIAINSTFTIPANQTIQTNNFNISAVTKPAGLFVSTGGNQIYSAYMGSPLSLASTSSFFHQYFNYQGFDLLSFIPIIFAAMFTRNTVGVGMAMVVVCIATLSWLSVVVVSDTTIAISVVIAAIGMIGYRSIYG